MTSRRRAAIVALTLAVVTVSLLIVNTPGHAGDRQQLAAGDAIRHEFGTGWLAGCFLAIADRETGHTFNPRTSNWTDRHSDGSSGSWGLFQIGSLWRRPNETVAAFRLRMYDPVQAAATAHRLYRLYGLRPWGSC